MSAEFDIHADRYAATVERSIAFSGLRHDFFLRAKARLLGEVFAARFPEGRPTLLDVGCGVGELHGLLLPLTAALSGCDLSDESLERAAQRHPSVAYRRSGEAALPFGDASHDVSLAVCVFHHVPKPARPALVHEMRRVTRPGGIAVVIEHNPFNPLTRLAVARCPFDADAELLRAGETEALLREAGFAAVASRHFLLLPSESAPALRIEGAFRRLPLGAQYATIGAA
ncbi:class I SAM-dependent methyltransferase [Aureimonas leprariae]|uniref:class I SAM-dependent methyltransferase n=1 Tax=Plantimonas leprariae TaxID=2615207 RepID=UPI001FEBEE8E|nr:class I SAM-dependent methyltransferase [Aureimonas leprariae]